MDAVNFLAAYDRVCQVRQGCDGCPIAKECLKAQRTKEDAEEVVETVEILKNENLDGELKTTLQRYVNTLKKDHWRYRKKITEAAAAKDGETERFYYGICTQIMMTVCELERWLEE